MAGLRHVDPQKRRGGGYRAVAWVTSPRAMGRVSQALIWKIDPIVMRLTRGRLGFGLLLPTALLETRGARTGEPRANAVIYFHDGERATIVASKLGLPKHPSWFHNLCANPDVKLGGEPFRASVVDSPAERERLWALADQVFPGYAAYRERAAQAGRTIPLVQLAPRM